MLPDVVGLQCLRRGSLASGTGKFEGDDGFRLFWFLGGRADVLQDRQGRVVDEMDLVLCFYRVYTHRQYALGEGGRLGMEVSESGVHVVGEDFLD